MKNVFCNKLRLVPQSCQNQSRCHVLLPHLASLPIRRVKMGVAIAVLWLGCPDKPFGRFLKIHMSTHELSFYGKIFFIFLEIFLKSACRKFTAILEKNCKSKC